jgi:hypothetical protein
MAEMDNAIAKLTEDMEQAQQKVSVVSAQLRKYTLHFSLLHCRADCGYSRLCGDMSDIKYGSTNSRITQELRVLLHPMSQSVDFYRTSLKLPIDFSSSNGFLGVFNPRLPVHIRAS